MVNLFVNYYIDINLERQQELDQCLCSNFKNKLIDNLIVLIDNENIAIPIPTYRNKVVVLCMGKRPSFNDYFKVTEMLPDESDINIICNSDIYFDEEGIKLISENLKQNECYSLSRWDIQADGSSVHFNRRDSYDAWVFKGLIKGISDCHFNLGVCGCDDSIAERLQRAGYIVKNPSIDIKTYHLHLSGIRNYKRGVLTPRPYLLIHPHKINETNIVKQIIP